MSEIVGLNGVALKPSMPERPQVPDDSAERAKQMPDPVTYHLLCVVPKAEQTFDSGLVKADQTTHFEEVMTRVLFVAKVGPDAFKDPKRFPSGPSCKEGDFVLVRPNTGTRFKVHETEMRLIVDESVEAVVQDPRAIKGV